MNKVIFLGTSAGIPNPKRNLSALAVIFNTTNEFWLFDCGEGTQRQIGQTNLKLSKLTNIFISHLHGDHIFGLPGLFATMGLLGIKKDINIFGPMGLENYLRSSLDYSYTHIPYSYHIYSIDKEKFLTTNLLWEKGDTAVYCAILNHNIDSFGYTIIKKNIKRNILVDKLLNLGIHPGPIYKKFKEDKIVNLEDGRILAASDFIKETITTKKLCYCGDTMFSPNAVSLSQGADLLIHEATFSSNSKGKATQSYHSTVEDAIKVASLAKVKKLVLTHISSRYNASENESDMYSEFSENISKNDPEIIIAEDFTEIKI
ncbi:MAG: ribonuclease Z [Atribacterota bacterium]|nr:ribonuclease Z [Atribacterota bacterium]